MDMDVGGDKSVGSTLSAETAGGSMWRFSRASGWIVGWISVSGRALRFGNLLVLVVIPRGAAPSRHDRARSGLRDRDTARCLEDK